MPIEASKLEEILRAGIEGSDVRIEDLAGDNDHYAAYITSNSFNGLTRIAQHKLVHAALKGTEADGLHALSIQTFPVED